MNSKGELFICDFGNCLNLRHKLNFQNFNFFGTFEYSSPEVYELKFK